jgi:hypothetical protein
MWLVAWRTLPPIGNPRSVYASRYGGQFAQFRHGPFDYVNVDRRGLISRLDGSRGIDIRELAH